MNNRTNKFLTRVDAHLKNLADDTKRSFLAQQIAAWELREERGA